MLKRVLWIGIPAAVKQEATVRISMLTNGTLISYQHCTVHLHPHLVTWHRYHSRNWHGVETNAKESGPTKLWGPRGSSLTILQEWTGTFGSTESELICEKITGIWRLANITPVYTRESGKQHSITCASMTLQVGERLVQPRVDAEALKRWYTSGRSDFSRSFNSLSFKQTAQNPKNGAQKMLSTIWGSISINQYASHRWCQSEYRRISP